MAKQFWEDDATVAPSNASPEGNFWEGDADAAKQELPKDVKPSTEQGGRGSVNPLNVAEMRSEANKDKPSTVMAAAFRRVDRPKAPDTRPLLERSVEGATDGERARLVRQERRADWEQDQINLRTPSVTGSTRPKDDAALNRGADFGLAMEGDGPISRVAGPVGRVAGKVVSGVAQGLGGVAEAAGDITGIDALARAGKATAEGAEAFQKGMGKGTDAGGFGPNSPVPYLAEQAEGAASSLGQSAALAGAFGSRAVIAAQAILQGGQSYNEARQAGMDPATALARAVPQGAFEAIGEKFQGLDKLTGAMGTLLQRGASDAAKRTAADALVKAGIREIPGEVLTYLGQTGTDLIPGIGLNPNMTMDQFLKGLADTVVQSAIMGGATAGGGHAAGGQINRAPQMSAAELARSKGFLRPEATTAPGTPAEAAVAPDSPVPAAVSPVAPVTPTPAAPVEVTNPAPAAQVSPIAEPVVPAAPVAAVEPEPAPAPPAGAFARAALAAGAVTPDGTPTAMNDPKARPKTMAEQQEAMNAVEQLEAEQDAQADFEAAMLGDQTLPPAPPEGAQDAPAPSPAPSAPAQTPAAPAAPAQPERTSAPAAAKGASETNGGEAGAKQPIRKAAPAADEGDRAEGGAVSAPAVPAVAPAVRTSGKRDATPAARPAEAVDATPAPGATDRAEPAAGEASGTYPTLAAATKYIREQRARGATIAAAPFTRPDGAVTIATKGTPQYEQALDQRQARLKGEKNVRSTGNVQPVAGRGDRSGGDNSAGSVAPALGRADATGAARAAIPAKPGVPAQPAPLGRERGIDALSGDAVARQREIRRVMKEQRVGVNKAGQIVDAAATQAATDTAAHEAATSPLNTTPEPTQAQKEAGNYRMGHLSGEQTQGVDISVENPKDSTRSGTSPDGTKWSNTMGAHYGYAKRSLAADGDHVDVFVGPAADRAPTVWVIDQVNADGTYDEAKALFGFMNKGAALKAYKGSYAKGWKVGPVTAMPVAEFKEGLASGRFKKPLAPAEIVKLRNSSISAQSSTPTDTARSSYKEPAIAAVNEYVAGAIDKPALIAKLGALKMTEAQVGAVTMRLQDDFSAADIRAVLASKPKRELKADRLMREAEEARAAYFARGNVVRSYGGRFDRVIAYEPGSSDQDRWSVTVQAVKQTAPGKFEDVPGESSRTHSTQPREHEMKTGPVTRMATPEAVAAKPNGESFGELYHGTPLAFDKFDPDRIGSMGSGEDHQGRAIYLTSDRTGYGRFFARNGVAKRARKDKTLTQEQADALIDSDGTVLNVELNPKAKILDMRSGAVDPQVQTLFDQANRDPKAGNLLRRRVMELGYDGIAFKEPVGADGWETDPDATTVAVYRSDAVRITGNEAPAKGFIPDDRAKRIAAAQRTGTADADAKRVAAGNRARARAWEDNPGRAFIAKHGIALDLAGEWAPGVAERRAAMVQGFGPIFRKNGMQLDTLAEAAVEEGFLKEADEQAMHALIDKAIRKQRVAPLYAEGVAENEMEARIAQQRQFEEDAIDAVNDPLLSDEFLQSLYNAEGLDDVNALLQDIGATNEEIRLETQYLADAAQRRTARDPGSVEGVAGNEEAPDSAEGREGARAAVGDEATLKQPSVQEVVDQQERAAQGERAEAVARRARTARLDADAQVGEFTLTGSDRATDANPNQGAMFSVADDANTQAKSIEQAAAALGVELKIDVPPNVEAGDRVDIEWIARTRKMDKSKAAEKGAGAKVMQQLAAWADRHGIELRLGITDNRGAKKLQAYYERFGFERTDPLDNYDRIMAREPVEAAGVRLRTGEGAGPAVKTKPASAEHDRKAARLLANLKASQEGFISFQAVEPDDTSDVGKMLAAVRLTAKRLFGHDVVFVRFNGPAAFNGAMSTSSPDTVFVRVDSSKPHMAILGHELLHSLRAQSPGLYSAIEQRLNQLTNDQTTGYYRELKKKYDAIGREAPEGSKLREELYADIVGDHFLDPQFWDGMAADQRGLFRRVADAVVRFLDKVIAKLGVSDAFGTQAMLKDAQEARRVVIAGMRAFSEEARSRSGLAPLGASSLSATARKPAAATEFTRRSKVKHVVYHATNADFNTFDTTKSDLGAHFGTVEQANKVAASRLFGREGTTNIMPVYLDLRSPLRLKDVGTFHADGIAPQLAAKGWMTKAEAKAMVAAIDRDWTLRPKYDKQVRELIQSEGYDGVVYKNTHEGEGDSYIVFEPSQVKSATGNAGTFDRTSDDIRMSVSGQEPVFSDIFGSAAKPANISIDLKRVGEIQTDKVGNRSVLGMGVHSTVLLKDGTEEAAHQSANTVFDGKGGEIDPSVIVAFKNRFPGAKWVAVKTDPAQPSSTFYRAAKVSAPAPAPAQAPAQASAATFAAVSGTPQQALTRAIFGGSMEYMRDQNGKAVKAKDQIAKYKSLDTDERGQMLLRQGYVTADQLARWKASPLNVYDGAVNNRFRKHFESAGIVWSDAELRNIFKLDDAGVAAYRALRAQADESIARNAVATMLRLAGKDGLAVRDQVLSEPMDVAAMTLRDHLLALADQRRTPAPAPKVQMTEKERTDALTQAVRLEGEAEALSQKSPENPPAAALAKIDEAKALRANVAASIQAPAKMTAEAKVLVDRANAVVDLLDQANDDMGNGHVPDDMKAQARPNPWESTEPTRTDRVIYELQDGRIDLKRTQEAIEQSGAKIAEQFDARLAETLYSGRMAKRTQSFLEAEAKPLLQAMALQRVGQVELGDYLHARAAPERNAQIAKINADMPDGGAGSNSKGLLLTNDAARQYIADIPAERRAKLEALAQRVDGITRGTRALLVTEGLEKADTIAAWEAVYKTYVPMFREDVEFSRIVTSKRATGSEKKAVNILANVLLQREAAITRAEKNRIKVALYGLALSNPNPKFWVTIRPEGDRAQMLEDVKSMGIDPVDAEAGMASPPTITTVDPVDNLVTEKLNPFLRDLPTAITLKVNGENRVLLLNEDDPRAARMAAAMKGTDNLTQLDIAGSIVGKTTRWLAAVNTQYNPVFGIVNFMRDTMGGVIHLGNTELRGSGTKVVAGLPGAIKGITAHLAGRHDSGKWSKLFEQFQRDGGQTGFREMFADGTRRAEAVEKDLKRMAQSGVDPRRVARNMMSLLSGFNEVTENAVRLSAYAAALDKGISRAEAARLARELTVDFNRKGRATREIGPLYAFFNAAVQGNERTLRALRGPTGKYIIAGGLALGVMQGLMLAAAGIDDDEIPDYVKARAMVIPLFNKEKSYILVPLPLGLHVIPNTGRVITEMVLGDHKDMGKKAFDAVGEISGAFNPLGGGNVFTMDGALRTLLPTVVDPLVELGFNKNFAGNQIERDPRGETDIRPGFQRARESTQKRTSGQAYLGISKAMNWATGGSDFEAGKVSPTPERIRYVAQVALGGVLRETEKIIDTTTAAARGEPTKPGTIPVASRFYGEVDDERTQQSRYFQNKRNVEKLRNAEKAAHKAGNVEGLQRLQANPLHSVLKPAAKIDRSIQELNKLAVQVIGDIEQQKAVDAKRVEAMRTLNEGVKGIEQATNGPTLGDRLKVTP